MLQRSIGRPLTVVTGDFGMQLRAEAHGVAAVEIPERYAEDAKRRSRVTDET